MNAASTESSLIVAAAQTTCIDGDLAANLEQHLELARQAAEQGAQVLVFPELSLTGYLIADAPRLAMPRDDSRLRPIAEAAQLHALTLVVGLPLREHEGLYIASLAFAPDGKRTRYTKQHLSAFGTAAEVDRTIDGQVPPAEATVFQPGENSPLLRLGPLNAALAVCADTGRPGHARCARDQGASIYLASMFIIPSAYRADAGAARRHARENGLALVLANYAGTNGGLKAAGRSHICSHTGELLGELPSDGAGVVSARLDLGSPCRADPAIRVAECGP